MPRFSVCIPAFNRAEYLPELLQSIAVQNYSDYEVVICEDASPQRERIRDIVDAFRTRIAAPIHYFENDRNLGYDGNIRELIARSGGDYCLFAGNDDLLCPDALQNAAGALDRNRDVGVLLRGWAMFQGSPENITQTSRYFESERFFPAGADTIATFFRRCVVLPGLVMQRKKALEFATDLYDGTTLYQVYIAARILHELNGAFIPVILALRRDGVPPDFGVHSSERTRYVQGTQTVESSAHFLQDLLRIAQDIGRLHGNDLYERIVWDIANYSFPFLSIHADKPAAVFIRYGMRLGRLGLWRSPLFHLYFISLLLLGPSRMTSLACWVKQRVGATPRLGRVYRGKEKEDQEARHTVR